MSVFTQIGVHEESRQSPAEFLRFANERARVSIYIPPFAESDVEFISGSLWHGDIICASGQLYQKEDDGDDSDDEVAYHGPSFVVVIGNDGAKKCEPIDDYVIPQAVAARISNPAAFYSECPRIVGSVRLDPVRHAPLAARAAGDRAVSVLTRYQCAYLDNGTPWRYEYYDVETKHWCYLSPETPISLLTSGR